LTSGQISSGVRQKDGLFLAGDVIRQAEQRRRR
jgi:hypothetical protein